jgi:hypothetical protein
LARFAAAGVRSLYREESQCRIPLTEEPKQAALELFEELQSYSPGTSPVEGSVPTSLLDTLQRYFFLTVTTKIVSAHEEKFACPVQVYLACFGYNEDDTFKAPSQVTSLLANWQYLLRCTALYEANRLVELEQAESAFV